MGSKRAQQLARLRAERDVRCARCAPSTAGQASASSASDPVIGYVAHDGRQAVCDGDACIVAGSRDKMARIVAQLGPHWSGRQILETAKFRHIVQCLQLGAAYCFDEEAYGRFLGPARRIGMPLEEEDFSDPGPRGLHLVRVQQFGYLAGR